MAWNWAVLIATLLAGGTALYIRLRWYRAPQAYAGIIAMAFCYFTAAAVLGAWVLHVAGSRAASELSSSQLDSLRAPEIARLPSTTASPEVTAPGMSPTGYYCGTERWPVKTLSDEDRNAVNLQPVPSTVTELDALPRPPLLLDNRRVAPVELTTYLVRGVVVEIRDEEDHDVHIVIADPSDRRKTMITEIVDAGCSGAVASPDLSVLQRARETFNRSYSPPPGEKYWPKPGDLIEITGVGFFDVEHGQSGVAPNAIELHPVLDIRQLD